MKAIKKYSQKTPSFQKNGFLSKKKLANGFLSLENNFLYLRNRKLL